MVVYLDWYSDLPVLLDEKKMKKSTRDYNIMRSHHLDSIFGGQPRFHCYHKSLSNVSYRLKPRNFGNKAYYFATTISYAEYRAANDTPLGKESFRVCLEQNTE